MNSVVITGADRNIGLELARQFLQRGWQVFAGRFLMDLPLLSKLQKEFPDTLVLVPMDMSDERSVQAAADTIGRAADHVDMLIHNAAAFGSHDTGTIDFSTFMVPYNVNCLGAMRLVHSFLPLMRTGMKRLCFVSSEAGVVSVAHRTEISSYCMSKTALNMALRLMFNQLQPMGYSFRLFHPGWVCSARVERLEDLPPETINGRPPYGKFWPWEAAKAAACQFTEDREWEDRLVLIDNEGAAWPF